MNTANNRSVQLDGIDADAYEQAADIYKELGIDTATAVNMFLHATLRYRALPFSTFVPANSKERSAADEYAEYLRDAAYYEPPATDADNIITVLPLRNGAIPDKMFVQLVTKIPVGKLARWSDIFACLNHIYDLEVSGLPKRSLPYQNIYEELIPYWRLVGDKGIISEGRGGSREAIKEKLIKEGIPVVQRGSINGSYRIENYKNYLFDFSTLIPVNAI